MRKVPQALGAALLTLFVGAQSAYATDIASRPFSDVAPICPNCAEAASDIVRLTNGREIRAQVVAINGDFYTLVKYGEVRTVPARDVAQVVWQSGSQPQGIELRDQIVTASGHVLTGSFVAGSDKFKYIQLKSSHADVTFTVFTSQIAAIYRQGQLFEL